MSNAKPQLPDWYKTVIATHGAAVAEKRATRAEAHAAIIAAVAAHPEHVAGLIAADVAKELRRWLEGHGSSGDLIQASLFPDLPARMRVTPSRSLEVSAMTAAELDHARSMLWAQTQNAMEGAEAAAEARRAAFTRFYDQVRPLLAPGKTVREVIPQLAARTAA